MADLFKNTKLFRGDKQVDASELKNKIVGLYFSAHWCPPCRSFTPKLKEFYESLKEELFELIFVTSDRSEEGYLDYYNNHHGLWLRLEFNDPMINELAAKYSVNSIPMLIIINHEGKIINKNGRDDVMANASGTLQAWKDAATRS